MKNITDDLDEFVRESNAIEAVYAIPGEPLYDDHRAVAQRLAGGERLSPARIHGVLMHSEPDAHPGRYRRVDVYVGVHRKMAWPSVRAAMRALLARTRTVKAGQGEEWCWNAHHEFEHIHPFRDGNGRTGRLWMNMLRQERGLPWLTVYARERQAYYQRIMDWEFIAALGWR